MNTTVKATYSNGALIPQFALALDEGDEVTLTVETALTDPDGSTRRERFEREWRGLSVEERARRLAAIGRRCAGLPKDGPMASEIGDWLYDENGLPK